jgi:hypothetical protein
VHSENKQGVKKETENCDTSVLGHQLPAVVDTHSLLQNRHKKNIVIKGQHLQKPIQTKRPLNVD